MDLLHFISSHSLELITVVVSLIWLYLEYRASIWLWPVGILLPLLWIPICWQSRLYGMLAINIYYLVTSIIGWVVWLRKRGGEEEERPITDMNPRTALVYSLGAIVGYLGLLQLQPFIPEWQVPWADALTTIASIIGMIWMARKWRQHWLCWILANAAGFVALYGAEDYISSFVYVVNFITAFFGYRKWGRLMRSHDKAPASTTQP